jgi:hypothetical protein
MLFSRIVDRVPKPTTGYKISEAISHFKLGDPDTKELGQSERDICSTIDLSPSVKHESLSSGRVPKDVQEWPGLDCTPGQRG